MPEAVSGTKRFFDHLDDDIKNILLCQIRDLWTHTSTAIEGNSLTLGDTTFLLEEGLTVSGKPLKDHEEVYGHAQAIKLVYRYLDLERPTNEEIFALHKAILTQRITDVYKPVGAWKNEPNYTYYLSPQEEQLWRQFPSPQNTPKLMGQWLEKFKDWWERELSSEDAVYCYSELHLDFVTIHPFFDGNGRLARLLSNLPLLRSGWPPIVIQTEDRYRYNKIVSDYQSTITSMATLHDLKDLPCNAQKKEFISLCHTSWNPVLNLVKKARDQQKEKEKHKQTAGEQPPT